MGTELGLDDVAAGNPQAERELKAMRDELAMLRGALYDEQHGITATLRAEAHEAMLNQERERCAAECDRLTYALDHGGKSYLRPADARHCARAIRALKPNA